MIYKSNSDRLRLIPLTPIRKGEYATRLSTKGTCFLWKNDRAPEEEVEAEDRTMLESERKYPIGSQQKARAQIAGENRRCDVDEFQV